MVVIDDTCNMVQHPHLSENYCAIRGMLLDVCKLLVRESLGFLEYLGWDGKLPNVVHQCRQFYLCCLIWWEVKDLRQVVGQQLHTAGVDVEVRIVRHECQQHDRKVFLPGVVLPYLCGQF